MASNDSTTPAKGRPAKPASSGAKTMDPARARALAKTGMSVSMGVLVATGFSRTRGARRLHLAAGVSLVGFSVWHHMLYQPKSRNNK